MNTEALKTKIDELWENREALKNQENVKTIEEVIKKLDEATSVQLYYIAKEAVNNAIRHGHASRIRIALGFIHGKSCLRVTDNGVGFENPANGGTGLLIMRSRAESIAGNLTIFSRPGMGTCIRCCFCQNNWADLAETIHHQQ